MDQIISAIEKTAAISIAVVALLIFFTAVLRYGFSWNVPDGFDFARYLQGIAIMWGLTVATWRNGHITVDILWETASPKLKWWIDLVAGLIATMFFVCFAWAFLNRLPSMVGSGQVTSDMRLPIWPFYVCATFGVVATALVSVLALFKHSMKLDARHG